MGDKREVIKFCCCLTSTEGVIQILKIKALRHKILKIKALQKMLPRTPSTAPRNHEY